MSGKRRTQSAGERILAGLEEAVRWSKGEAEDWRTVYEGTGRRRPVPISVEVELDDVQSAWVKEEARRAGTNYAAVIRDAVDEARKKRSS